MSSLAARSISKNWPCLAMLAVVTSSASVSYSAGDVCPSGISFAGDSRYSVGDAPQDVAVADFDGDGDLDAAVCSRISDTVGIFKNNGEGLLELSSTLSGFAQPRALIAADITGDGLPDLAVTTVSSGSVSLLENTGGGEFQHVGSFGVGATPIEIAAADLNCDGLLDLVTANQGSDDASVLLNIGGGIFAAESRYSSGDFAFDVDIADIDLDGDPDVVLANRGSTNDVCVLINTGSGQFVGSDCLQAGTAPRGVVVADLNADGVPDIASANNGSDDISVYFGLGGGIFSAQVRFPAGSQPHDIEAGDLDNDGDIDLVVVDELDDRVLVLENDGVGSFADAGSFGVGDQPLRAAIADVDGDGDLDILTANNDTDDISVLLSDRLSVAYWTGESVQFSASQSWSSGEVPTTQPPSVAAFDSTVDQFGPVGFVLLQSDVATRAWTQANEEIELLMNGSSLILLGVNSMAGEIGLELGVLQCDGDDQLPTTAPLFRIGNASAGTSSIFSTPRLSLGRSGPADLEVIGTSGDVRFEVNGQFLIGEEGAGALRVPTNAARSRVVYGGSESASLTVGGGDEGTIELLRGCLESVGVIESAILGRDPGVTGTVRINGAQATSPCDSTWSHTGIELTVGQSGHGVIEIAGGARFQSDITTIITLAEQPGSSASILVSGVGSVWDAGFSLIAGGEGAVDIAIEDGGTLSGFGFVNAAGSTLRGDGVVSAPFVGVVNLGDIAPSSAVAGPNTAATLTLIGNFRQLDNPGDPRRSGRILLDLFDVGRGVSQADRLTIEGSAELSGALVVTAPVGVTFEAGMVLPLVSTSQPIGADRLDVALLPGLPDGKFFRLAYDLEGPGSGSVSLVVDTLGDDLGFGGPNDTAVAGIASAAELRDMNGDGFPEVILAIPDDTNPTTAPGSLLVLLNGGDADNNGEWDGFTGGVLQANTGIDPSDVALGDLDGDLIPDIAVSNRQDGTASLFVNNGVGLPVAFADIAFNHAPEAIVIGDLDEDGRNDVAVAGSDVDSSGQLTTRLNAGGVGGGWNGLSAGIDFDIGQGPTFMDIGDLDNDSCLDLLIGSEGDGGVNLLDNLAGGQGGAWAGFAAPLTFITGSAPFAGDIGDLDNDSCLDISVIDRQSAELFVILHSGGPGDFTFTPPAGIPAGGDNPRSVVISDLDGDSDGDIALVTDSDDGLSRVVRLLRNDRDPGVGQLQFAPSTLVPTIGEPLLVLADDVDGAVGQDLVAITDASGEQGRRGPSGPTGGISTALNIDHAAPGCNAADLTMPFGLLDLSDVSAFVSAFVANDLLADLNTDGVLDLSDVVFFVGAFVVGCP